MVYQNLSPKTVYQRCDAVGMPMLVFTEKYFSVVKCNGGTCIWLAIYRKVFYAEKQMHVTY